MPSNITGPPGGASGARERKREGGQPHLRPGAHPRPEVHPSYAHSAASHTPPRRNLYKETPAAGPVRKPSQAAPPPDPRVTAKPSGPSGRFRDALLPPDGRHPMPGFRALLLAVPCAAVYAGSVLLLGGTLNALTAQVPEPLGEGIRILLAPWPGAFLCNAVLWRLFPQERRMAAAVHWQLFRWPLTFLLILQALLWGDRAAQMLTLNFFLRFAAGPVLTGGGLSLLACCLLWRRGDSLYSP